MWFLFLSLGLGILIGVSPKIPVKFKEINDKLTIFIVIGLLFLMGISLGMNKDVINNIENVGLKGFLFGLFTTLFSVFITYIIVKLVFRGDKK